MQLNKKQISLKEADDSTFPKSVRLRKRAEFTRLLSSTNRISGRGFLVVWYVNSSKESRLGVTVSKKIGNAVTRNRVKRYVREIFRRAQIRFILQPVDINVVARRGAKSMDFCSIQEELNKIFEDIGKTQC